jgi:NAD(P)-dependent dehydrogenase (short-subunit alcohol dehydrogenase family)
MNALASCPKAQPGGSANPLTSLAALPLDLSVAGRADTTEDVGEVDILINNAGIALFGPTAEFDVSAFDKMFASNVRAPFFLVAAFAPGMAAGGVGLVGGAAYGATKASLEAMTHAWAAEYSASGMRVNAIAPGPVYTPSPSGPEFITALGETTPMHRASQPEEIAEVVAFLASPRASYITGTTVAADGGRRAI